MIIGVLTGGGDCPGLNAVIRAIVKSADTHGSTVIGFRDGWKGVLDDRADELHNDDKTDRILTRGGTVLGSGRIHPDRLRQDVDHIRRTFAARRLDALIAIGGEGTLSAAAWLADLGLPVIGVPKTIDNDIDRTDVTFGFDTALTIATDAIDRLHTTAESHQRVLLAEVMGRHAGWIALHAGIAAGAHLVLIPEEPFDIDDVCAQINKRFARGDRHCIAVIAEGASPIPGTMNVRDGGVDEFGHQRFTGIGQQLATEIERRVAKEVRTTVLGHVQRGGTPTPFDRVLATRLGIRAVDAAHSRSHGMMVALTGTELTLVPLRTATSRLKTVPTHHFHEATRVLS